MDDCGLWSSARARVGLATLRRRLPRTTRWTCLAILVIVLLFFGSRQWRWLNAYRVFDLPPRWDEATYHLRAFRYFDVIEQSGWTGFWELFTNPNEPRPPLLPLSTLTLYGFRPYEVRFAHLIVLAYLVLMALATYFIGEHFCGPPGGLFASLYLLFFPATLIYSREVLSDLPTAALISVVILFLLKSEWYTNTAWNVAVGVAIGLAMYARNFAGIYVIVPLLYAMYRGLRLQGPIVLMKLLPGVAASLAVMVPWYMHHVDALTGFFSKYLYGEYATIHLEPGGSEFFSTSGADLPPVYYARVLFFAGPSPYFGVIGVYLMIRNLIERRVRTLQTPGASPLLWLWLGGSFVILSTISNVSHNYLLPALPALAVSMEVLARRLDMSRAVRVAALLPILAMGYTHFSTTSGYEIGDTLRQIYPQVTKGATIDPNWHIGDILETIRKVEGQRSIRVGIIGSHPFFSSNAFRFEAQQRRLPFSISESLLDTEIDIKTCMLGSDYIITKTGFQWPTSAAIGPVRLRSFIDDGYLRYDQLPFGFGLPDGSTGLIFRHLAHMPVIHTNDMSPHPGRRSFPPRGGLTRGEAVNPVSVIFDQQIELEGVCIQERLGFWHARYFWHVLQAPTTTLEAFVHFLEPKDRIAIREGVSLQGDHRLGVTRTILDWKPGDCVVDARQLRDFTGVEGIASIGIGLWRAPKGSRLAISASTVRTDQEGTRAIIPFGYAKGGLPGELESGRGRELVAKEVSFGDVIGLASCKIEALDAGQMAIRYTWRSLDKAVQDYMFFVHLTDESGKVIFQNDHEPLAGQLPTTQWRPGEWIAEQFVLSPPPGIDLSRLDLRLGVQTVAQPTQLLRVLDDGVETDWDGSRLILRTAMAK